jgi:hypothetical protein
LTKTEIAWFFRSILYTSLVVVVVKYRYSLPRTFWICASSGR